MASVSNPVRETAAEDPPETILRSPARYLWVMLLARIYEAFPLTCPRCRAEMRIIALITEAVDVWVILEHIGEPATPPRIAQARGPPEWYEDATERAIDAEACSRGRSLRPACDAAVATQYLWAEDGSSSDRAGGRFQPDCGPSQSAGGWRVWADQRPWREER